MDRRIARGFHQLEASARGLEYRVAGMLGVAQHLTYDLEQLMEDTQAILQKITELGQKESDYQAREQAIVDALTAQRDALQKQIDAGGTIDGASVIAALQGLIDAVPSATPPTVPDQPAS